MARPSHPAEYDSFAAVYDRHWGGGFARRVLPVLDTLVLGSLPPPARLLDLCCGTGQLAGMLTARGYRVTGLDISPRMLAFARRNAPAARFVLGDARTFHQPRAHHAVLCVFDSLNHVPSLAELGAVFRRVHAVLLDGGVFVFDLNDAAGYEARWRGSFSLVEDDTVCVVRSQWRPQERRGDVQVTLFERRRGWRRSDFTLTQHCYDEAEVASALEGAGFATLRIQDAARDLGLAGDVGRTFFVARR
jgi:SAM-dependent methyltransferase